MVRKQHSAKCQTTEAKKHKVGFKSRDFGPYSRVLGLISMIFELIFVVYPENEVIEYLKEHQQKQ